MDFPLARQRFYQEIRQPQEQIDLAKAALFLAQEEYPTLEPEDYLALLDQMALDIKERLPSNHYPLRIIQTINHYLFEELQFYGNAEDYYDPRNSYLNQVLDRHTGIPITLSLIYLEVAKRIDFPMVGIGMPGHFLIRPAIGDMQIFVDPFNRGEVLFAEDCQERLKQLFGEPIALRPEFLEAVDARYFLLRMLTNLKAIYLQQRDLTRLLAVIERMLLIHPNAPLAQRERGLLYYQLGRWTEAAQDLESYLSQIPMAEDASLMQELLRRMGRTN
ncbi:SirB1 family protein [Thermocoleostomius sinensis]|jgi:regulator of sirC expression with transglutaminase-like and TPR domain|uniref:Transglutaminase-like domain-containing protein n=1 Tax=Thermocoleostomius sinensis A174 TaxID=2016057 RepID=A0A9E9CA94_9CYAN|nr:transglutaminase-like domain-containing protein [Thermocoleostomius sinensis]WAL60677.1 transglutaminase-like domain-containing protein [Thermocoleostomius sinensis A174]